jgi:hypothetical protein
MAWVKGQTGNAGGRPKEKPFADALRMALAEEDPTTKKRRLRVIADKLVESACQGEPWAIREVMDRIDGKPTQAIEATLNDEREPRDLSDEELVTRTAAALRRVEELTAGDRGKKTGKNGSSDVRKFN